MLLLSFSCSVKSSSGVAHSARWSFRTQGQELNRPASHSWIWKLTRMKSSMPSVAPLMYISKGCTLSLSILCLEFSVAPIELTRFSVNSGRLSSITSMKIEQDWTQREPSWCDQAPAWLHCWSKPITDSVSSSDSKFISCHKFPDVVLKILWKVCLYGVFV